MRSLAFASLLVFVGCASGGGTGGGEQQDAGNGTAPRDAGRMTEDAAPAELDAGEARDAGGHVVLPEPDAGPDMRDAGMPDAGTRDAGTPDAGGTGPCAGAADGTACDADGDGCTVDDRCVGGSCVPGPREECGGELACGSEMCVSTGPNSFRCEVSGGGGSCNDGDACTSGDACRPDGSCAGTPIIDSREPNDTRTSARNLGSISDRDSWPYASFTANLYPDGDEDWYRYFDSDDLFGSIYPRVDLINIPSGSNYDLCAYFQCPSGSTEASCESGSSSTSGGLPGCCSRAGGSANESVRLNPNCSGSDDSGTVYVRVWRLSGAPVCANYTLRWGDD